MTVEAMVFDIGNVLLEWDPVRFYDREIGEKRRMALFEAVELDAMNLSIDAGAPFRETIYAMADRHPEYRDEIRMWHDRWLDIASPSIDASVALLALLRARGVPVFALTNFGAETFELAKARYPFLAWFDRCYVSAHLRLVKPDPSLYAHVERDCGVPAEYLLFADDRIENIEAAARRGWQTHHFVDPDGFARKLLRCELISEADLENTSVSTRASQK